MIRARIDATVFYTVLKMVSKVLDEVTVRFYDDGMRIRQLDMGEVSMVDAFIPRNWFSEYEVVTMTDNLGKTVGNTIAFRISDVKLLKKRPKKDAKVELGHGIESGQGTVKFGLSGLTMVVPCFPDDGKELPLPKIDLKQKAKTNPKLLLDFAKEAIHVTDAVRLMANDTELLLTAKGEISEMTRALSDEEDDIIEYSLTKGVCASYDLNRFLKFVESAFDGWVQVEFDKDLPLKLTYTLSSGDITSWDQKAQVVFFLAPKVERDGGYTPPKTEQPENECDGCHIKFFTVNVEDVDGKVMNLCDKCLDAVKHGIKPWEKQEEPKVEPVVEQPQDPQIQVVDVRVEQPKPEEPYVCEVCGAEIPDGEETRLEDGDTIVCSQHKPEEPAATLPSEVEQAKDIVKEVFGSVGSRIVEDAKKEELKPVAVVDPLEAFRNRWSKK